MPFGTTNNAIELVGRSLVVRNSGKDSSMIPMQGPCVVILKRAIRRYVIQRELKLQTDIRRVVSECGNVYKGSGSD